jgi:hypothetical protein
MGFFMNRSCVVLSLVPLLFTMFAGSNAKAESECIQGQVVDSAGAAVPFVFVIAASLDHESSIQVETGEDGRFRINQGLADEQYDVLATDHSWNDSIGFSETGSVAATRVKAGAESRCPQLALLMPARARIRVHATDALTGEAIKSAHAHFRFDTDKSWREEIYDYGDLLMPPGSDVEVEVGASGFENSEAIHIATALPGKSTELAVELRQVQTGCITGTVLDLEGLGVPGAGIQTSSGDTNFHEGTRVFTDAKGLFSLGSVRPGKYTLSVTAADYPPSLTQQGMMIEVTVPSELNCATATIRLGPKASKIAVKVIDGVTMETVSDAEVWASGDFTDLGGWSLKIGGVPGPVPALTPLTIHAKADGYLDAEPLIFPPLKPEETKAITVTLQPERRAKCAPARTYRPLDCPLGSSLKEGLLPDGTIQAQPNMAMFQCGEECRRRPLAGFRQATSKARQPT